MSAATTGELLTGALLHGAAWATPSLLAAAALGRVRWVSASARHAAWSVTLLALPAWPLLAATRGVTAPVDLGVLWLLGTVGFLAPLLVGTLRLVRLAATATPHPQRPEVSVVDACLGPLTFGWWRPRVLLPSASLRWPSCTLQAALAHEQAHVARRDWLVHVAVWGASATLWFHPLMWWARREHAQLTELAADDLAIASGIRPSAYARALLSLATTPTPAALGVGTHHLRHRVSAALRRGPRAHRRWPTAIAVLLLLVASFAAAAAVPRPPDPPLTCIEGPLP
ncbi:MAG: M56 family metallopeptidase [Myxococcales bacterium]|nr:M56 family metallopeptidase [Myxococcales bacterium]